MKQVIVLRTDLEMSTGKLIAQACHASLGAYKNADGMAQDRWETDGATKIAVEGESEDRLMELFKKARSMDISAYIVKDAGETELDPGTVTALGIGPDDTETVDKVTKDLPLM
jgi:PTH2 family peptidyl-tRNA hydrolase